MSPRIFFKYLIQALNLHTRLLKYFFRKTIWMFQTIKDTASILNALRK